MTHQPELLPDQPSPDQAERDAERAAYLDRLREYLHDPAFRAIEALSLPVDDLLEALKEGGLPCAVEELQRRFADFVRHNMHGHDSRNTRLTLDR